MTREVSLPIPLSSGILTGILIGISVRTGIDVSQEGILYQIMNAFCNAGVTGLCGYLWFFGILLFFGSLFTILRDASENWSLYIIGFGGGLLLMVFG